MKGTKTIQFDFDFEYSDNGAYVRTSEITLTAPGLGRFHVHSQIHATVMDAMFSMAKRAAEIHGLAKARQIADEEEAESANREPPTALETLDQIALGLGPEKFAAFADFLRKTLTNAPRLARVGQGNAPISDEVWERLEEAGGLDAVREVLGAYLSFFVRPEKSRRRSGVSSHHISFSDTKGGSPSSTPSRRPSKS